MPSSSFTQPAVDIGDPASLGAAVKRLQQQAAAFGRFTETEMPKIAQEVEQNIFRPMLDALRHYAQRKLGMKMRWSSRKQQRFVIMMLKKEGNLPYKRTGSLARGWKNKVTVDGHKGFISIATLNDAVSTLGGKTTPYSRFVQGDIGSNLQNYAAPIQPFHKDRGWQPAQPVVELAHTQATKRAFVLLDEAAARVLQGRK